MKFKVGDRVRVKEGLETGRLYGDLAFTVDMEGCRGKTFVVCDTDEYRGYKLKGAYCVYNDEMLEPAPFGKSDLQTGMRVRYRSGKERIVLKNDDEMVFTSVDGRYAPGSDFNDDLTCIGCPSMDIMEVLKPIALRKALEHDCELISVWKREEEPIEITIEEIAKLKGVSPERIRIKKAE